MGKVNRNPWHSSPGCDSAFIQSKTNTAGRPDDPPYAARLCTCPRSRDTCWHVPTSGRRGDHPLQRHCTSPRPRDTRWHVPTSGRRGDHPLQRHCTSLRPRDTVWHVPTSERRGDHRMQRSCTSTAFRDIRWHVPTSTRRGDHLVQLPRTSTVPGTSVGTCPLQHVEVTTSCSCLARLLVPGTSVGTCPLQHVEVTTVRAAASHIHAFRDTRWHVPTSTRRGDHLVQLPRTSPRPRDTRWNAPTARG